MLKLTTNSVLASEVAEFLGKNLHGEDLAIYKPGTIDTISNNCIIYLNKDDLPHLANVRNFVEVLVLSPVDLGPSAPASFIVTQNPELDFIHIINHFFSKTITPMKHPHAVVEEGAAIGRDVSLLAGCFIGPEVEIGEGSIIFQNVVITGKVKIGNNCIIKANSTIGSEIFDFVFGEKEWEQRPQIGTIWIGDNVWIGANTTIEKGSLSDTIIGNGVKIDDLVQIGSGSTIGADSIIAAGTVICTHVNIGKKCWVAPHTSILQNLKIGDGATIGLGSVVIHDLECGIVAAGNPAKQIGKK